MTTRRPPSGLPLRVQSIGVAFTDPGGRVRDVLDVANLELAAGSQSALCGPSGSGKTTLLHVLAGIERVSRGSVRWGAVEVTGLPAVVADRWRRETVGFVFQQFHLFAGLTALENVLLPFRFDRWKVPAEARSRACSLLDRVGVRADTDVALLSRGEVQRVAVARALVRQPSIVLADEPTASLDAHAARAVGDLLAELCDASRATLLVATHDGALAARLATIFDLVDGDVRLRGSATSRPRLVGS